MDREKTRQVAGQIFRDMAGAMTAGMVYVGTRTGLFRAMRGKGPMRLDERSIGRARQLGSRVDFAVGTAASLAGKGRFDFITMCDCLHDLAEPLQTLRDVRALLEPDGTLFVVEPRAADRLEENRNDVATMFYGFSIFHCMTQSLARGGPGLGTCMGPAVAERLLRDAGFSSFEILPLKSQVNAFYAARP